MGKSRGEQDSTSQDSATDSGLCPDSEGMSPTPHSDDERTLKQNSCDKHPPKGSTELSDCQATVSVNLETVLCLNLPNGHTEKDQGQDSDDDFGNFEFASSQRVKTDSKEDFGVEVVRRKLLSGEQQNTECHIGDNDLNIQFPTEMINTEIEEKKTSLTKSSSFQSNLNRVAVVESDFMIANENICKYEPSHFQIDEPTVEKFDVASSNDSSSFNSVDISLEPKEATECVKVEKFDSKNIDIVEETHKGGSESTTDNLDYREEKETEITVENGDNNDDDDFDDFTDFKANFPSCCDNSISEQGDKFHEHSKTFTEETKLEETAFSLPPSNQEESDDEFSNFADFSSSDCAFVSAQSSNSLENVSHIPLKLDDSDLRTESEFQVSYMCLNLSC